MNRVCRVNPEKQGKVRHGIISIGNQTMYTWNLEASHQGSLTEEEGSVQLTSLNLLV